MDFRSFLKNPYIISLPTLVVPGLSHFILGKKVRAVIFFCVVFLTFILGILLNGGIFFVRESNWLYSLASLGEMGMGLTYLICLLSDINRASPEIISSLMFGYGTTFLITAGLMNMLLMMDAFDIAIGRKVYE
ncbi:MAG: hypothetical protein N2445_01295 [Acidobacteria bacterium]|nr:hypothetical protein [Acidobacteriota bacterium]